MARFLNTRGKSTLGIGICARCSRKMSLTELHSDPNAPGLMVCRDDLDQFDPYRLAPRQPENIALQFARPDVKLYPGPVQYPVDQIQAVIAVNSNTLTRQDAIGSGMPSEAIEAEPLFAIAAGPTVEIEIAVGGSVLGVEDETDDVVAVAAPITQVNVSQPWSANTAYILGAQVTPTNPFGMDAVGQTFYVFTCIVPGVSGASAPTWTTDVGTGVLDGTTIWLNAGLYQP